MKLKQILKASLFFPILQKINYIYASYLPKDYVSKRYKIFYKKKLNWNNPQLLSEKMQILKLYNYPNNLLVAKAADKYTLHEYLKENDLDYLSVPYVSVFESTEDVNYEELESAFVLKKTNASNMNLIIKDKSIINKEELKRVLDKWLKVDFGKVTAQPHYSESKDRIIYEPFYEDIGNEYRLFMVNGEIGFVQIILWDWEKKENGKIVRNSNKIEGHRKHYRIHTDEKWNILWQDEDTPQNIVKKPLDWDKIVEISRKIGKDFPVVRIDFNKISGNLKITELTMTPSACYLDILKKCPDLDIKLGKKLNI